MQFTKLLATLPFVVGMASAAFTGDATFFNPGLGACGQTNGDADFVVALSPAQFAAQGNICGKHIQANFNGGFVFAQIVDKCPGCGANDIDLSPAAFAHIADLSIGRLHGVTWDYLPA